MATVNKEMSIGQVLNLDRSTASIFMQHGMHCLGCPHATAESLEGRLCGARRGRRLACG